MIRVWHWWRKGCCGLIRNRLLVFLRGAAVVKKGIADLQLLLGGGLARSKELIKAWHWWGKRGYGIVRIRVLIFIVRIKESSWSFTDTLGGVEAGARRFSLK